MPPNELVNREVIYCVSALMYELREVAERLGDYDTYLTLVGGKQDYESAATSFISNDADMDELLKIHEEFNDDKFDPNERFRLSIEDLVDRTEGAYEWVCEEFSLNTEYREPYEHWIVSNWLASKLENKGEVVESYLGLMIWGRCTTGQAIYMDAVIEEICKEINDE
jgi:hypothetical protein